MKGYVLLTSPKAAGQLRDTGVSMWHVQRRSGGHTRAVGLALQQPFMWGPKPAMDLNRKRVEGRAPLVEPNSPKILERFEIFLDFDRDGGS